VADRGDGEGEGLSLPMLYVIGLRVMGVRGRRLYVPSVPTSICEKEALRNGMVRCW